MMNAENNATTAKNNPAKPKKRRLLIAAAAAVACLGIAGGTAAVLHNSAAGGLAAAQAVYPEMAKYPNEMSLSFDHDYERWYESRRAQHCGSEGYADGLWDFYGDSTRQFLSGAGENRVYSPISLYMALSMLAEISDGQTRGQILELLSADDIAALRTQAGQVWNENYCDDGAITSVLGNSLWLDDSLDYRSDVLEALARELYASSYSGKFGSSEMNTALRGWLNEQTGGLLSDAVDNIEIPPEAVMALYSTVYFKGKWDTRFNSANNDTKAFHAPNGDIDAEFMNASMTRSYYWGEDFGAIRLDFASGCGMWFFLPDEDKSVDDVLSAGEYMQLVKSRGISENSKYLIVDYSVPKFDVSSTIDLSDGMKALGITDAFDPEAAEYCLLDGDNSGVILGRATHSARVKIDEEGCEAAAFTEMVACGAACPPDERVEFVLDRPFLFVISGMDGQPLFTGTVYLP
ncbi:MAG: serpin family protein [Oscillospiraceae bacterium]